MSRRIVKQGASMVWRRELKIAAGNWLFLGALNFDRFEETFLETSRARLFSAQKHSIDFLSFYSSFSSRISYGVNETNGGVRD